MPAHCAAYGCKVRRTAESKKLGITFHRFPKDDDMRRKWEVAVRRKSFAAKEQTVLCSKHFNPEDFDKTGGLCRIRQGVIPSVFNFSLPCEKSKGKRTATISRKPKECLPLLVCTSEKPKAKRSTITSKKAEESLLLNISQPVIENKHQPNVDLEHNYSLPSCPSALKVRFNEAVARVLVLEKEKRNAQVRERRAKATINALLLVLTEKNLVNEELYDKMQKYFDLHSGLPLEFFKKRTQNQYSAEQREFANNLHLHGPKAYKFFRDTLNLPLPHPRSLQRWLPCSEKPEQAVL
ncbi:THAP domain-containing protein 2-like isoform X2 [Nerophis ophidion]|uniref:THAP domain-containing protein 2-like isoform X2 n=1 Tax=Nerophis ophidion TaxID=159077 RepID=UPI002AE057A5|nr:THAP domain-containing protein 2-like isoform X2 [Nerophis ophidion]